MNHKVQYEKKKVTFHYLGKHYSGDIVCSHIDAGTYWFVFDQIDVKPFGGSVEFTIENGHLKPILEYPDYELFLLCIKRTIDTHRKELCN